MATLVPARVRAGTVKHRIDQIGDRGPPTAPQSGGGIASGAEYRDQQQCVTNRGAIFTFEELAHRRARQWGLIPVCFGEAEFDRTFGIMPRQAVVEDFRRTHEDGGAVVGILFHENILG